ncbi:DUF742 domain-containing protein [Pseudonocardia nematodicida]|uniref:DUF742 domain-containing protein n=1 Tax=Pseudonocardia nematodicida TaxID=1206997 RepID=A0ABV1K4C6_9PSEU
MPEAEENLVGLTGARFGGHSTKRKRKSRKERAADQAAREQADAEAARGTEPAAPDPDGDWDTAPLPVVAAAPEPAPQAAFAPVRPYVITGGRTRVRMELRLETLVSAVPGPGRVESGEKAVVLSLCEQARSVSEVAALARVPLGVARVLIDDLATEGRVRVHGVSSAEDGPSMALMDRVLSGLRNL